ncbi:TPA: MMPL family transporter [Candidatus Woesearchaeota archaeon]|nr:MMPL family transporter [Candidatus Woesearchaeota archaeon]
MSLYKKTLRKTAHFQTHHPYFTLVVLVVLTLLVSTGMSNVKTVASLEKMMPEDMEEIKYFNVLRDNFLGKDMIGIVIDVDMESQNEKGIFDIRDKRVLEYIENLKEQIGQEDDVIETFGVTNILRDINNNELPDEETFNSLLKEKKTAALISNYINDDFSTTYIIANTDVGTDDLRLNNLAEAIYDDINDAGRPAGIKVRVTGIPIIQQELSRMIKHDRISTMWISALLVFIIILLLYRNFFSSLLPVIVVVTSVTWLYGTMGYFNLGISTLAGGVAAIVIGIGIDYAIHLMNRYKYERKHGKKIIEATEEAVVSTGAALIATALTTLAAFFAFLFGKMPEMGRFGTLMIIGIAYALFFTIIGLPALLVIEEKLVVFYRKKIKKILD